MKVLVCISNVPDTTSKIDFVENNTQFNKAGVVFVMNPYDEFGLTRAMWLKEKQGAHVTVVNVGDSSSDTNLRKALAIGADEAIRVDAEPSDAYFVAQQLAKVAEDGNYDLIITGRESIDYNGGVVPGMLAAKLDYAFVNGAIGLEIEGSEATVSREIDGGKEILKVNLPLVLAGQKGLVEEKDLKIPNMRGIMMAKRKPLNVLAPAGNGPRTEVLNYEKQAPRAAVKLVDPSNADELISLLVNDAKVL